MSMRVLGLFQLMFLHYVSYFLPFCGPHLFFFFFQYQVLWKYLVGWWIFLYSFRHNWVLLWNIARSLAISSLCHVLLCWVALGSAYVQPAAPVTPLLRQDSPVNSTQSRGLHLTGRNRLYSWCCVNVGSVPSIPSDGSFFIFSKLANSDQYSRGIPCTSPQLSLSLLSPLSCRVSLRQ